MENKKISIWVITGLLLSIFCITAIDIRKSNQNVEIFLNDLYMEQRKSDHILICTYYEVDDKYYKIDCKNTFKYFSNTKVPKYFLSDEYLENNYEIKLVTRYCYPFGKNYLIGWYRIPKKELRKKVTDTFLEASDRLKYIDRVFDYVFN